MDCCELDEVLDTELFKALADPNRVALLVQLASCDEPKTVGSLSKCCPVNLSVVSRHLAHLRSAGLVSCEKVGRKVFYTVNGKTLAARLRAIADALDGTPA